jgi:uncharacterized membrane protein YccC
MNYLPDWRAWLFSFRSFAAAMIAMYIAFSADLPRPYWALASVYIASQPLSGATRSKAIFRLLGTLLGAAAAVALVPNLVNAPWLLSLALAGWVGTCLFFSLLDRTPRSYVFMLGGYTAAIIGFPSVANPGAIFDTASARVQEIGLGIVCATMVHSLVLPTPVGPAVAQRIREALRVAEGWIGIALAGEADAEVVMENRRRIAGAASELDLLDSFLAWDPTQRLLAGHKLQQFRWRLLMLIPVITSIRDRVHSLRLTGKIPPALEQILRSTRAWLRVEDADLVPTGKALRQRIGALEAGPELGADWSQLLTASLLLRLRDLTQLWEDCRQVEQQIREPGRRKATMIYPAEAELGAVRLVDFGMALWSGLAAAVAILICCALWIYGSWDDGAVAAELLAVICSFFAAQDNPVPAMLVFLKCTVVALFIDAVLLFGVLPQVHDFSTLVLVLAPVYLLFGVVIAMPRVAPIGTAILVVGSTLLSLDSFYDADFPTFINAGIAAVLGMMIAAVTTAIIRSVGAEESARRLMRQAWVELEAAALRRGARDRGVFAARMLDRVSLLMPRLASVDSMGPDTPVSRLLADLRVGLNIVDLRRARHELPEEARASVDTMLDALAAHFRCHREGKSADPAALLAGIDAALGKVTMLPDGPGRRDALMGLVGVRSTLCHDAPPYRPIPPTPAPALAEAHQAAG